ncbi:hypothetical protein K378_01829 [Streptomyces sp. Amel2xB2]|nr:hypothetical protein K378_01829 [Streptomyces sp. Amel2xB2]
MIVAKLAPQQLVQLGACGRLLATSIAQIAASSAANQPLSVDDVVGTAKGRGMVGAASFSLPAPTTKNGAKVFSALPDELRTPELVKVLHMFTDFGGTPNSVDKFKIMPLARQIAIITASQAGRRPSGTSARQSEESRL